MKQNTIWEVEVQMPTFRQASDSAHVMSPLNAKISGFDNVVVPPLFISDEPFDKEGREQKEIKETENDLFFSKRGHDSFTSFTSASTETPSRDTSLKSKYSPKATSRKSTRSGSRRKPRRKSESAPPTAPFDPTRVPKKSCMKQKSGSESAPLRKLRRKREGKTMKVYLPGGVCVKRQRSIHFHEEVFVREFRPCLSLANNDPRVLWWQDDEHDSIKENLQRLINRVNRHGVSRTNGRKYCVRGLERFLDPDDVRDADRKEAEEAVLHEQSFQNECGNFDDLRIASVYFRSTRSSMLRATRRGLEDALIAHSLHETEPSPFRTSMSSGSLNGSIGLSQLPKRPSSFSGLPRRSSFNRVEDQKQKHKQKKRKPRRCQSFSHQERSGVPAIA